MKANTSLLALVAAISFSVAGTSYAHENYSDGGSLHWVGHVSESKGTPTENRLAPFGYAATNNAGREVDLPVGSKFLNVTRLETVKINVGGKSVVWTFDTLGTAAFPLSRIVAGADDITVYVTENPAYQGG